MFFRGRHAEDVGRHNHNMGAKINPSALLRHLWSTDADVCFAPKATVLLYRGEMSRRAITGLMHRSKKALFDHFIGLGEYRRRHREAECFGGLEVDYQLVPGGCLHG
jgi:hypothetical protein